MFCKISNILILVFLFSACQEAKQANISETKSVSAVTPFSLDELQHRTFIFFWEQVDANFQTQDRYPTLNFSSTAATGFGLASYLVGIERNFITRAEAANRVLKTLQVLKNLPQGEEPSGVSGYKGFFYHFLDLKNANRYKQVELSSIDTGLLMAGVLSAQSFFDKKNKTENEIRELADFLYRRVEWDWMLNEENKLSMGWHPEKGFIKNDWDGYNEAMILLVLAIGSPTHPIPADCWKTWCDTYQWEKFQGYEFVNFDPLFGHQYSQMFIDFREIQDEYMREKGIDYFENSRRATYANRDFCVENKNGWKGYDTHTWGLTACDGPVEKANGWKNEIDGKKFRSYSARGTSTIDGFDDGTIAPTAAGGSVPFAPEICIPALKNMWEKHYENLIGEYGFKDAFNLTYTYGEGNEQGWFDEDYLGIDQGAILIQVENHRSGLIWEVIKKNKYVVEGLKKAGFAGGWLEKTK
jgi:hypothetical protein